MTAAPFRFSARPLGIGSHRTIYNVILIEVLMSFAYTLFIIVLGAQPEGLIGGAIRWWIQETTELWPFLLLVPAPDGSDGSPSADQVGVYRHVLAASIAIALTILLLSRRHWRYWAVCTNANLTQVLGGRWAARHAALVGYRRTVLGLVAMALLVLWEFISR